MIVTVLAILIGLLYYFVIYPLFLSPLSSLPGPKHLKLTSLFILNKSRKEQRNEYLQKLHEKYGDVVQIGPNEVAFNSFEHMKRIYMGNFPKEFDNNGVGFYSQFGNFNERNLFSTGDSKAHIEKKRNVSKVYSKSSVIQSGGYIKAKIDKAWDAIDRNLGKSMNVYSLFLSLAMDVVSGFEYGSKYSTNFLTEIDHTTASIEGKSSNEDVFLGFRESSSMWFYTTLAPSLWSPVAKWYGIGAKMGKAQQWIYHRFQEALTSLQQGSSLSDDQLQSPVSTMISSMFEEFTKEPNGTSKSLLRYEQIASEIADHVVAGHETTGTTLTYICWELSRPCNRQWQDKLFEECQQSTGDIQKLDQLPVLHSVIQEACRLHSAIPGSEPRYVPRSQEGSKFEVTLNDSTKTKVEIPPGTVVSCQPWSLHLLQTPFGSNPRQFDPSRWLRDQASGETEEEYETRLKTMNNSIFTFGQGNRMCLGMNLALIEMKYCIATLYSKYTTSICPKWCANVCQQNKDVLMGRRGSATSTYPSTDLDLMRMADTYTTSPMMGQCWLRFESRDAH
ncbi:unnamed protein product [Kluyveromyces dobzhanskii CBS 2104]|uniref:WGS project CCBQ000000000 data, contig 00102 n=1 Tax=Kluyveromyces dobzhanskii CBS 2104 TaxID=1427455 RepID=A0A0A8L437_9SACH|nr:unnamed protein product [Kluyveromyces dobzhanskii CBS 2104]